MDSNPDKVKYANRKASSISQTSYGTVFSSASASEDLKSSFKKLYNAKRPDEARTQLDITIGNSDRTYYAASSPLKPIIVPLGFAVSSYLAPTRD